MISSKTPRKRKFFKIALSSYLSRTYGKFGAGLISEKPDISTCNRIASALLTCNPIAYGIIGISLNLISPFEILAGLLPNFAGVQIAVAKLPPLSLRDFATLKPIPFLVVVLFFCHVSNFPVLEESNLRNSNLLPTRSNFSQRLQKVSA